MLTSQLDKYTIRDPLDGDRQGGLPSRGCARTRPNLNSQVVGLTNDLCPQIAAIEFRYQRLRDVSRAKVAVEDFLIHDSDYNREPRFVLIQRVV